jgi:hypothetical protein
MSHATRHGDRTQVCWHLIGELEMWLTKDERRLIAGYYRNCAEPGLMSARRGGWFSPVAYELDEVSKLLRRGVVRISQYGSSQLDNSAGHPGIEKMKDASGSVVRGRARVVRANQLLAERGLVMVEDHTTQADVCLIRLTLAGFDLGRRYSNWWDRSGLRFQEYRNHWIWLIVSLFGGALAALLTQWAERRLSWK